MYLKNVQKNGDRERVAEGGDEKHEMPIVWKEKQKSFK